MLNRKIKYWVSLVNGNKYPFYHPLYNLHGSDKRYSNLGIDNRQPLVYDLPKSDYPFTVEYA